MTFVFTPQCPESGSKPLIFKCLKSFGIWLTPSYNPALPLVLRQNLDKGPAISKLNEGLLGPLHHHVPSTTHSLPHGLLFTPQTKLWFTWLTISLTLSLPEKFNEPFMCNLLTFCHIRNTAHSHRAGYRICRTQSNTQNMGPFPQNH